MNGDDVLVDGDDGSEDKCNDDNDGSHGNATMREMMIVIVMKKTVGTISPSLIIKHNYSCYAAAGPMKMTPFCHSPCQV